MEKQYADVIIDISHEAVDRIFQYKIPECLQEKVNIGMQVIVPFGQGNRKRKGFVVGVSSIASYDEKKIKALLDIDCNDEVVEQDLLKLAAWMREQYGSTMIQALKTVLPVRENMQQKENQTLTCLVSKEEGEKLLKEYESRHFVAKFRLMAALLEKQRVPMGMAKKELMVPQSTIKKMEADHILAVDREETYRNPQVMKDQDLVVHQLNEEQQKAVDIFKEDYLAKDYKTYLLHGVTGSGKTQVYLAMIDAVLKQGRQAIVLIPEIALTYQTVQRFAFSFPGQVTVINSKLSKGERYDQFLRAKRGEVQVVIGPRSALFTPFSNLGLIIIDEEHESTYKSDNVPKYHARETAIQRAKIANASVVLGSATPSIESYTNAQLGRYKLLQLRERVEGRALPKVYVEDLKQELKEGNKSMFSRRLKMLIKDRLEKKEQIMLFINRRGYAGFVSCRECGYVEECPHCDVALKLHKDGRLRCHYCGYERPVHTTCPKCHSPYISAFGTGTQKVEAALKRVFPEARVLRMDYDTTSKKGGHEKVLSAFANKEADVLVGTQMIVKGHDFEDVTLVGVIAADLSLHSHDFRGGERTFDLLTQAAGRAGRGKYPGEVVIQTYSKEHYSIVAAAAQDYQSFYEQEIAYRRIMKYPPVYQMLLVFLAGEKDEQVIACGKQLAQLFQEEDRKLTVVGPTWASVAKINDIYRQVMYLKHIEYARLVEAKDRMEAYLEKINPQFKDVRVYFDFNPVNIY